MAEITSRQNPLVVRLSKLSERKHREAEGLFLAEGIKLAAEALSACAVEYLLYEEGVPTEEMLHLADRCGGRALSVSREVMMKVSTEAAPQGVIAVARMDRSLHRAAEADMTLTGPVMILDRIRDPGNMGTALRSAEAFGGVTLLTSGCADVYNPKTVRGSMGAAFRTPTVEFESTAAAVSFARSRGYRTYAAALDSTALSLHSVDESLWERFAAVIGTEGSGLPPEVIECCDGTVYIPMSGGESLNASVAASVIMWERFRRSL